MNDNNIYEGKKYENHEMEQLIEDFERYRNENPGVPPCLKVKVEVDNPKYSDESKLWLITGDWRNPQSFSFGYSLVKGVYHLKKKEWIHGTYKGSITIIELPFSKYSKPEVYKEGDWVEVMESVKYVPWYEKSEWDESITTGKVYEIIKAHDDLEGVYYKLCTDKEKNQGWFVPHYAVKKVPPPEERVTITIDGKTSTISRKALEEIKKLISK